MATQTGFQPSFFRPEPPFAALPKKSGELRLFLLPWNSYTMVLGGGGIKQKGTRTYQECPELNQAADHLKEVATRLDFLIGEELLLAPPSGGFYNNSGKLLTIVHLTNDLLKWN